MPRACGGRERLDAAADAVIAALLETSLNYEATLVRLARAAVPALADWCVVDIVDDDGRIRRLAAAHVEPGKERWAWEINRRYSPRPDAACGVAAVVRNGRSEWTAEITPELLAQSARDVEHLAILRQLGMRSGVCVPLRARGRTLGALTFVTVESDRLYDEQDVAVLEDLGARAALLVDNARLFSDLCRTDQQLRRSRDHLNVILDNVADGITVQNAEGRVVYANDAAAEILGLSSAATLLAIPPAELVGAFDVLDEHGAPLALAELPSRRVLRGEPSAERMLRYRRRDTGDERWALTKARAGTRDQGPTRLAINIFTDVTALKEAERSRAALAAREEIIRVRTEAERKFRGIVESAPDAIVGVDEAGRITVVNSLAERMFGYGRGALLGRPLETLLPERFRDDHQEHRRRYAADPRTRPMDAGLADLKGLRQDGTEFPAELSLSPISTAEGLLLIAIIRDVTDRKRAEAQMAHLAYHDGLTGLPNRTMLERHLASALARAKRGREALALLYIDLDEFKAVNDSLGHLAGDDLLRQVAQRLSSLTRETDLLARHGGDEFLLVAADIPENDGAGAAAAALRVADRIHHALREPFTLEGRELRVGVSIGVSVFPYDAEDGRALLRHADAALYRGKASGRGTTVLYSHECGDPVERLCVTTRLRCAAERGQFVLHYQPLVDLVDGTVFGAEALVRWLDPERGLVLPHDFIPTAEGLGLIEPIGDWVVAEACRQARAWADAGIALSIGLNLSPRQLWQPDLAERLVAHVHGAALPTDAFVLELTESTAMQESERGEEAMRALAAAGFRLAVDDFGTGFSSLNRLKVLPVRLLKIDRSFVRDIADDERAFGIVKAVVDLAHHLGLEPVAEGIENEAQLRRVLDAGCRRGQGFYFSPPVPADEFPLTSAVVPA